MTQRPLSFIIVTIVAVDLIHISRADGAGLDRCLCFRPRRRRRRLRALGRMVGHRRRGRRAVRATYVDEIDSDDSDDDEREWSLRHALEEFGVTKVRVKGKQGVALFGSEKDASDALHAHRLGAWRLSSPAVDASGEQILYQGASSPQVEDDLERLLAAGGT